MRGQSNGRGKLSTVVWEISSSHNKLQVDRLASEKVMIVSSSNMSGMPTFTSSFGEGGENDSVC